MGLLHFPAEFFQDEERDGFLVPEMMKRAWAAELEVLEVVRRVCAEHNRCWGQSVIRALYLGMTISMSICFGMNMTVSLR